MHVVSRAEALPVRNDSCQRKLLSAMMLVLKYKGKYPCKVITSTVKIWPCPFKLQS